MIDWRFLTGLTALLALSGWLARRALEDMPGGEPALVAGLVFSFVSLAAGYHLIRWSASRGPRQFMAALLGGFLFRIAGVAIFGFALAWGTSANLAVALLTVVAAHVVLGTAEIVYLHRTDALR